MASIQGDLSTNLISVWLETGAVTDDLHGSNSLTNVNSVTQVAGVQGNAGDFEAGSTQYLSISDASQTGLDISGNFTIAFWMNRESDTASHIVGKRNGNFGATSRAYAIWLDALGATNLDCNLSNGTTDTWKGVTWAPSLATWYHVAFVYDTGGNGKFYVNGAQQGATQTGYPTAIYNNAIPFTIGVNANTLANYFDGKLNQVCIWNTNLSGSDIATLYNSGTGIPYADPGGGAVQTFSPSGGVAYSGGVQMY